MKISQIAVHKFGLQTLKTVAVLILFFAVSFILNVSVASTIQKVAAESKAADAKTNAMLKMIDN